MIARESDRQRTWQAQLADMPEATILDYLRSKGHGDVAGVLEMRMRGKDVQIMLMGTPKRGTPLPFDIRDEWRLLAPLADDDVEDRRP